MTPCHHLLATHGYRAPCHLEAGHDGPHEAPCAHPRRSLARASTGALWAECLDCGAVMVPVGAALVERDEGDKLVTELVAMAPEGFVDTGRRRGEHVASIRHSADTDRWAGRIEVTRYGVRIELNELTPDEARRVVGCLATPPPDDRR